MNCRPESAADNVKGLADSAGMRERRSEKESRGLSSLWRNA